MSVLRLTNPLLLVVALLATGTSLAQTQRNSAIHIHQYGNFKEIALNNGSAETQRSQVQVAGQTLTLSLQDNNRVIEQLVDHLGQVQLLRGTLDNKPQSWVRLTRSAQGAQGLIWDGTDMYVVTPAASVSGQLDMPTDTTDSIVFKLSDTSVDLGADYCGSETHVDNAAANTGLATYQALTEELNTQAASTTSTLRLEIEALADAAFRAEYASDTDARDALLVRINNVDGIFSAQLGLEVQATQLDFATNNSGLSSSTDAQTLLESLGKMRKSSADMRSFAATHLFTGRDLDGDTLGIAYVGQLCDSRYAASLSEVRDRGAWIDSLVLAHELGHQLGAVHDGTASCTSTDANSFLMSAQINGSSEFSSCSKQSILALMQTAACLVPVSSADLALTNTELTQTPDTASQWQLPISNIGSDTATTIMLHIALPSGVEVASSSIAGGSCVTNVTSSGGSIDCVLDQLAANETRYLTLDISCLTVGSYTLLAEISSISDSNADNNLATYTLQISDNPSVATATVSSAKATSGGGALGHCMLAGLSLLLAWRRRRQYIAQPLH